MFMFFLQLFKEAIVQGKTPVTIQQQGKINALD